MKSVLVTLIFPLMIFAAKKDRDWKMGKVADSSMSTSEYTRGTTTTANTNGTISPDYGAGSTVHATTTANTTVRHVEVDTNHVVIIGTDFIYWVQDPTQHGRGPIGTAIVNRKHGCRFIVGENIKYDQDRRSLYVLDADGKQCKLEIVRQERPEPPQTQATNEHMADVGKALGASDAPRQTGVDRLPEPSRIELPAKSINTKPDGSLEFTGHWTLKDSEAPPGQLPFAAQLLNSTVIRCSPSQRTCEEYRAQILGGVLLPVEPMVFGVVLWEGGRIVATRDIGFYSQLLLQVDEGTGDVQMEFRRAANPGQARVYERWVLE